MMMFILILFLQFPGITYQNVNTTRTCNYAYTSYPSVTNVKYSMFQELTQIPLAAQILTANKIKLISGPINPSTPPSSVMTSQGYIFEDASITENVQVIVQPGEKSCAMVEYQALVNLAQASVQEPAIAGVLNKYGVILNALVPPYTQIFP